MQSTQAFGDCNQDWLIGVIDDDKDEDCEVIKDGNFGRPCVNLPECSSPSLEENRNSDNCQQSCNSVGSLVNSQMKGQRIVPRCNITGCPNQRVEGGVCWRHGANVTVKCCSVEGCDKRARRARLCIRHGTLAGTPRSSSKCSIEGCPNFAQSHSVCYVHGAKRFVKQCSYVGCQRTARKQGLCATHGGKARRCTVAGCERQIISNNVCCAHGAKRFRRSTRPNLSNDEKL